MRTAKMSYSLMQAANIRQARIKTHCWTNILRKSLSLIKNAKMWTNTPTLPPLKKLKKNDFNLNIPRYVDTFEEEEEIDIDAVQLEIDRLEEELSVVRGEMGRLMQGIRR